MAIDLQKLFLTISGWLYRVVVLTNMPFSDQEYEKIQSIISVPPQ